MVHADVLPTAGLRAVSRQANALAASGPDPARRSVLVAEPSIPVWVLDLESLQDAEEGLSRKLEILAVPTRQRHHQIYLDAGQPGYIRVSDPDPDWQIMEFSVGELAERLDLAAAWIEESVAGDPFARLLIVPALRLHAFWLVQLSGEDGQVVIADIAPDVAALHGQHLYAEQEFLRALHAAEPIIGLFE